MIHVTSIKGTMLQYSQKEMLPEWKSILYNPKWTRGQMPARALAQIVCQGGFLQKGRGIYVGPGVFLQSPQIPRGGTRVLRVPARSALPSEAPPVTRGALITWPPPLASAPPSHPIQKQLIPSHPGVTLPSANVRVSHCRSFRSSRFKRRLFPAFQAKAIFVCVWEREPWCDAN